jgi:hypothetical protein
MTFKMAQHIEKRAMKSTTRSLFRKAAMVMNFLDPAWDFWYNCRCFKELIVFFKRLNGDIR